MNITKTFIYFGISWDFVGSFDTRLDRRVETQLIAWLLLFLHKPTQLLALQAASHKSLWSVLSAQCFDTMSFGQSVAEMKFWEMPELVDRLLPFLDVESTLGLAQVQELTQKILQGSHAWNKLIRRSSLSNLPTASKEKRDVVKHLTAILKLTKAPKANMLDLLDTISPPDVVQRFLGLGAVVIVSPTHPDSRRVLLSDFLLLEEVEGAFGTTEQNVEEIFSPAWRSNGPLEEPVLSALSSRLSRQQKRLTYFHFSSVVLESKESAEALKTILQACNQDAIRLPGTITVPKPIGGEGWKMLAEGLSLHPGLGLNKVTVLKEDLEEANKEDIRVIWDALLLSGVVSVELDPGNHGRETVTKTAVGWTKLTQIQEMNKDEWAAQFLQLKVVGGPDFIEFHFIIKQTTKMKKLMNYYSRRVGVPGYILRFTIDGRRIRNEETPKSLEMEQYDVIEVYRE